jgi:hypothetical protein
LLMLIERLQDAHVSYSAHAAAREHDSQAARGDRHG